MAENLIEPLAGTPAPAEITPISSADAAPAEETPADQGAELSDEILRIPALQVLMAGAPGAASLKIADMAETDEGKKIAANAKPLQSAGFFFYRALSKDVGVIANGLFVTPQQIQEADKAGQLSQIAPDFQMLNNEAAKSGEINPVLTAQTPAGPPTAPAPPVPQSASGMLPPPPASVQNKAASARLKNLAPSSPTSGPVAGRGRILDALLRPAL